MKATCVQNWTDPPNQLEVKTSQHHMPADQCGQAAGATATRIIQAFTTREWAWAVLISITTLFCFVFVKVDNFPQLVLLLGIIFMAFI